MEKSLSSIYNDIDILKEDIISTTEYKNYKKYLEKVDSNKEIKSIINSIIKLQNEIVFTTEKICALIVCFVLGGIVIYYISQFVHI